jgi:hypothetical protein
VPGALENTAQFAAGRFPTKGIWIMNESDFHFLAGSDQGPSVLRT